MKAEIEETRKFVLAAVESGEKFWIVSLKRHSEVYGTMGRTLATTAAAEMVAGLKVAIEVAEREVAVDRTVVEVSGRQRN